MAHFATADHTPLNAGEYALAAGTLANLAEAGDVLALEARLTMIGNTCASTAQAGLFNGALPVTPVSSNKPTSTI